MFTTAFVDDMAEVDEIVLENTEIQKEVKVETRSTTRKRQFRWIQVHVEINDGLL